MATDYYYYGQGKVWTKRLNDVGGKWRWWGDVSAANLAMQLEKLEHKESYSGAKGLARSFPTSKGITLNATLHQLDSDSLSEVLFGTKTDIAAGAVVAEPLPTVAIGDTIKLDFGGVSALSIVDSAGTPATVASANYSLDPRFGSIEILALPGATVQPWKASYSHTAGKQVAVFTSAQPIVQMRIETINLAENNAPVIIELYRCSTDPLQELALINNDTSLAGVQITLAALIDPTKPAAGALGQYGRFIQLPAA